MKRRAYPPVGVEVNVLENGAVLLPRCRVDFTVTRIVAAVYTYELRTTVEMPTRFDAR